MLKGNLTRGRRRIYTGTKQNKSIITFNTKNKKLKIISPSNSCSS